MAGIYQEFNLKLALIFLNISLLRLKKVIINLPLRSINSKIIYNFIPGIVTMYI